MRKKVEENFRSLIIGYRKRYPRFYLNYLSPWVVRYQFSKEREFLNKNIIVTNTHPSMFFFTTYKCASVYVSSIMNRICKEKNWNTIDLDGYFSRTDHVRYQQLPEIFTAKSNFIEYGYFFGPFRFYSPLPQLNKNPVLLLLRDPRDIVTSYYYSMKYSHGILHEENLFLQGEANEFSVDEYVIRKAPFFKNIFDDYSTLLGRSNVLFTSYSKLVLEFDDWLESVASFVGMEDQNTLLNKIREDANFSTDENKFSHKRQVMPGDHKRKLKPKTVDQLTEYFDDTLSVYGFEK